LRAVISGLHGYMPYPFEDLPLLSEPIGDDLVGYAVDRDFVNGWSSALAELANDADQELPLFG
jgi:hypothetical protein